MFKKKILACVVTASLSPLLFTSSLAVAANEPQAASAVVSASSMAERTGFTFSDLVAGYVNGYDRTNKTFAMKTRNGHELSVKIGDNAYAEFVRNLGEEFKNATDKLDVMLTQGRYVYAYGVFYPDGGQYALEATHLVFPTSQDNQYVFEQSDWWSRQIRELADFYLQAEFGDGPIDYTRYRTNLSLEGDKLGDGIQEAATLSRLIYGFATAYMMTGEDRYWEAAQKGTAYLRANFQVNKGEQFYWLHALDVNGKNGVETFAGSRFSDDYNAIPCYEQIYDLAGPVQTYRITGDSAILQDVEKTLALFEDRYRDKSAQGGYFSHIDSSTFSPHAESLGDNRSKKNWNSVGDHAPAYLINLWLATGRTEYADFLEDTFDTIVARFPSVSESPFVNERFFADWSVDAGYKWQQDRAVIGHDLKIAWNLMRMNNLRPKASYSELAQTLGDAMPKYGADLQRGGWYDVVDRKRDDGQSQHRFAFHDRKAWWQQEQGILAYQILAGVTGNPDYLQLARESSAFYNAWFLDRADGGVYFNVLAGGQPYVEGMERSKGSHSMAGYHAFELAYLSAVYNKLLILKQPMDLYFRPQANGFTGNLLRVQPDILPQGSVKIDKVWVNGELYEDFDPANLTVTLPRDHQEMSVKVRLTPA
ncbi:AGE family epimerase/isomerase [Hahella sp. HN01]|uniref:AGE family epimerase/isomerase n=1 Tax=Hahella sp. HN01 TaxID=2847262 RepID=UPI001C1F002A|nr:AGE family epimerase/isomerase [Hahella sp. HN01]MBU6951037.1 AGE family epimerase/isomerase [Hahella sp. HN01]